MKKNQFRMLLLYLVMQLAPMGVAAQNDTLNKAPLIVARQGSFAIGGTITTNEQGLKRHADHGYVFFQQPLHPHRLPVVFLHGIYQSTSTWESTPVGAKAFKVCFCELDILPTT